MDNNIKDKNTQLVKLNNQKISSLLITIFILLVIFGLCAFVIATKPALESEYNQPTILDTSYYNSRKQWGSTTPGTVPNTSPSAQLELGATDTTTATKITYGDCNVYTYDNNFGIYSKPNLKTVIQDSLGGLLQVGQLPDPGEVFCVDRDQIVAKESVHTCEGTKCISVFGNDIKQGSIESFSVACKQNNNICKDLLAAISFNFSLSEVDSGTITPTTLCLSVENITVSTSLYEKIPDFYKKAGLFIDGKNDRTQYPAKITFENCNPLDYRQKFRIKRYTWTSQAGSDPSFTPSPTNGFFCDMVFRIGNLKLSYIDGNFVFVDNIIDQEPLWLLIPPLDLSTNKITTVQRYQMSTLFTNQNSLFGTSSWPWAKHIGVNTNGHAFDPIISPSSGLEVIDTTFLTNSSNQRWISDSVMKTLGPGDGSYSADIVVFEQQKTTPIMFGSHYNYNFVIGTNNDNGPGKLGFLTSHEWQNWVETSSTTYPPSLVPTDSGHIKYKYKMIKQGNINDNSTFYGTLSSQIGWDWAGTDENLYVGATVYFAIQTSITYPSNFDNKEESYSPNIKQVTLGNKQYLQDGDAIWQKMNLYDGIVTFQPSYFTDANGVSGSPLGTITTPYTGTAAGVSYIQPKQNMLTYIETSYAYVSGMSLPDSNPYTVDTGSSLNSSIFGPNATGSFSLNLSVGISSGDDIVTVDSFDIIKSGENNNQGTKKVNVKLNNGAVVNDLIIITENQDVNYVAVPGISGEANASFNVQSITNNKTSLIFNNPAVKNGGYGYQKGQIIYIVQLDSFDNVLTTGLDSSIKTLNDFINNRSEVEKLASVKVATTEPYYGSKHSLLDPGSTPPLSNYFDNYPFLKETYSPIQPPNSNTNKIFGNSPPQIAFLGKNTSPNPLTEYVVMDIAKLHLVNSTNPEDFLKIFEQFKGNDSPVTTADFIETIQFSSLNYNNNNFFNNQFANTIKPNNTKEDIILGKFIPYRYFSTINSGTNLNSFLFNNNYSQFIPYGLKHVYETYMEANKLPSF